MQFFRALIGKSKEKADNSMPSHGRFESAMVYTCIAFFVIAVVFVGFTYSGKWQAGLIEVSCPAFLFVIFLHILKIVIPQSSGRIITALSVIIAVMLIYANYGLQKNKNSEYTFKELLVGDLLVKKLIVKHMEIPESLLTKKLKGIIPGEFVQTRTEKGTIESPFERPEKDLMGNPVILPLDNPVSVSIRKEIVHSFGIPKETMNYKLALANNEGLKVGRARAVTEGFVVLLDKFKEQISGPHTPDSLHLPSEAGVFNNRLYRTVYGKPESPDVVSEVQMQTAISEEHVAEEADKQ
jgi:hypothetical protein